MSPTGRIHKYKNLRKIINHFSSNILGTRDQAQTNENKNSHQFVRSCSEENQLVPLAFESIWPNVVEINLSNDKCI